MKSIHFYRKGLYFKLQTKLSNLIDLENINNIDYIDNVVFEYNEMASVYNNILKKFDEKYSLNVTHNHTYRYLDDSGKWRYSNVSYNFDTPYLGSYIGDVKCGNIVWNGKIL